MPIKKLHEAMTMKRLFTVYECDNGFIAEIGEAGKHGTVVGMTVSEVTAAAQAQLATAKLREDDEDDAKTDLQKRVEKIQHSQGQAVQTGAQYTPSQRNRMLDRPFKANP